MNCKDCIHYDICKQFYLYHFFADIPTRMAEKCKNYKDKSRCIELPCKVGDYVFDISDGTVYKTRVLQFVYTDHLAIRTVSSFPNASEIGKRIFLTKEEAEAKLKEMKNNEHQRNSKANT